MGASLFEAVETQQGFLWHTHIALRIAGGVSLSWQRIAQQIPPGRSYSTHCLLMPSWVFSCQLQWSWICWHMLTYVDMFEPVTCSRLVLAHRRKTFQFLHPVQLGAYCQESVCTIMFLGSLLGSFLFQYTMLRKMSMTMMNSAYVFGTLPLLVAIHVLRREVKLRQERWSWDVRLSGLPSGNLT